MWEIPMYGNMEEFMIPSVIGINESLVDYFFQNFPLPPLYIPS